MISTDRISLFVIFTGPRGSCKTLNLTALVCQRLMKSYFLKKCRGVESKVWSNYPVGFNFKSPLENGKRIYLQPLPLNMEAFYTFDKALAHGWVFISELDQWYDRQEWMAVTQKLINKVLTQIRKKKLSLVADVQDINWINARGYFQADIIVNCREAAFSPWGRRLGLDLGEAAFVSFKDKSGIMTGYSYEETGRAYNHIFWGKRFWNCYDTDYQFNPLETATRYKLKLPTKIIEMGGASRPDDVGNVYPLISEQKERDFVVLSHVIDDLVGEGRTQVDTSEFWRRAKAIGFSRSIQHGGAMLPELGVQRSGYKGNKYSLEYVGGGMQLTPASPSIKKRKKELVKARK